MAMLSRQTGALPGERHGCLTQSLIAFTASLNSPATGETMADDTTTREIFERYIGRNKPPNLFDQRVLDIHTRQLIFSFRIMMTLILCIVAVVAFPIAWPSTLIIERLRALEELKIMDWAKNLLNLVLGAAIGLSLGSFYNPNNSGVIIHNDKDS
jgi:hypothetical protein